MTAAVTSSLSERRLYQAEMRTELAGFGIFLEDEVACRECGCSDSLACPGGCVWVAQELCSRCVEERAQAAGSEASGEAQPGRGVVATVVSALGRVTARVRSVCSNGGGR